MTFWNKQSYKKATSTGWLETPAGKLDIMEECAMKNEAMILWENVSYAQMDFNDMRSQNKV